MHVIAQPIPEHVRVPDTQDIQRGRCESELHWTPPARVRDRGVAGGHTTREELAMNTLTRQPYGSPGVIRAILAILTALGLVAGLAALPASAARTPSYFGLGDSIAAGTGGVVPTDLTVPCLQTAMAYPLQLAGTDLGCYGATTTTVSAQAAYVPSSASSVTITVGANDVGAGTVEIACATNPTPTACQDALYTSVSVLLPQLPSKLSATIAAVRSRAPRAAITLTGYPLLFTVSGLPASEQPVAGEINAATSALNATIAFTALTHGAGYADVTARFLNHGLGSTDPWINGLVVNSVTGTWDPGSFHPNAAGYTKGYVPAVSPFVR